MHADGPGAWSLVRWGAMVVLDGEEFLTVKEAARLLGVKPATLYAYVSRGVLRSYRQGIKRQRPADIPLAESWIRD